MRMFRLDFLGPIVGNRTVAVKPHPLLKRRNSAIFSGESGERELHRSSPEDVQYHKKKAEAHEAGNLPPVPPKEHQPIP